MPRRAFSLGRSTDVEQPSGAPVTPTPFELPPHHLVTHGVVVGMTGSGKTGLCLVMCEEAVLSGVPVLMIDIKGDLPNLLLAFPSLDAASFLPWIDEDGAVRGGTTAAGLAQETADGWRAGLAKWGLGPADVKALHDRVAPRLITPGATIGEPLDVLSSLSLPGALWDEDEEAARERLAAAVSLMLRLAGRDGDPRSRAHVVLSTFAERRLRAGTGATLAILLRDVLEPPLAMIGAMPFPDFMPPSEQRSLAQDLNTLLASPKLATWLRGAALDVAAWLTPQPDRTPVVIVSVAHLDDEERTLVLGLLLEEVLAYVRSQSGTSELRSLVMFDEVYGYLPPHPRDPPTKKPLLTLLKQARAFGVGVVLTTQNPMDLDYKALSNAGAWFLGRLQTDADRERVVEGLMGADGGLGGLDPTGVGGVLKNLPKRTFFVRDVHRAPVCALLETRWCLSWLRGPLTRRELSKLSKTLAGGEPPAASPPAPTLPAAAATADAALAAVDTPFPPRAAPSVATPTTAPPPAPAGWRTFHGPAPPGARYVPYVAATVLLRARDSKLGLAVERRHTLVAPLGADGRADVARASAIDPAGLEHPAQPGASYVPLPPDLGTRRAAQAAERALRDHVAANYPVVVDVQRELSLFRRDDESREAFVARCQTESERAAADEQRVIAARFAPRLAKANERLGAAQRELAAAQQSLSASPPDFGALVVGLAVSKRLGSSMRRSRTTAEAATRKAHAAAGKADAALRALVTEQGHELAAALDTARRSAATVESLRLLPKKGDAELVSIGIAWTVGAGP